MTICWQHRAIPGKSIFYAGGGWKIYLCDNLSSEMTCWPNFENSIYHGENVMDILKTYRTDKPL